MGTGIVLNANQLKALEMVSADFVTDNDLYDNDITDVDLDVLTLNRLIDWDGDKSAFVMMEMGNIVLAEYGKHPFQQQAQPERRTVEIPCLSGDFYTTKHVQLNWVCPKCGGKRGETYRTLSYDGSLRVQCDGWHNPCGHIDKYSDVLNEVVAAIETGQHAEAAPQIPAQVDTFLFGKDVTMKRLQAHELHEADGTTLDDKDARIQQLEAIIASHQNSLSQEAHKSEQLQALLNEVAQVLTIKYACDDDWVRREIPDNELLQVYNGEENQVLHLIHVNDGLRMEHLRAVVAVAEKLNAALKK
jgi:hypothetical protein